VIKEKLTATLFVMLHLVIVLVHGEAHSQLHIQPTFWQRSFIALVIVIGPVIAMSLVWMRLQKIGLVLFLLTMAGSLFFGLANHFFISGSDNALEFHHEHWESVFRMTATSLAVVETVSVAWCVWALKQISRVGRGSAVRSCS
jgi:hypothetical protein